MDWLISLVTEIRSARTELNVPPAAKVPMSYKLANDAQFGWLERNNLALKRLARVAEDFVPAGASSGGPAVQVIVGGDQFGLHLEGVIDLEAEKARLSKGAAAAEKERDGLAARLANPNFTERAKPEAVDKARADHDAKAAEADRLRAALERLG